MKIRLREACVYLAGTFLCGAIWAQELVIFPETPVAGDTVTITVQNYDCYSFSEVNQQGNSIEIRLTSYATVCEEPDPSWSDFSTVVGPLEVGIYSVTFLQILNGKVPRIADTLNFQVVEERLNNQLSEGGINGLYYDPDSDGHYLYVLETDYTTLVVWNTFDSEGNQAWVYGTGELQHGQSLVAETYLNRNGQIVEDGVITASQVEFWGWIGVDIWSCSEGTVTFVSENPLFGSGEFTVKRLANVKQVGCDNVLD